MNLSFTLVTDIGLKKISGLNSLKSLNLDNRQLTDHGLAALTSMSLTFRRSLDEGWRRSQYLLACHANDWVGFCLVDAGLTGLTQLDLFGARITDSGTNCLRCECAHSEFDSYRFNLHGAFEPLVT
jgi:hypothetical protein